MLSGVVIPENLKDSVVVKKKENRIQVLYYIPAYTRSTFKSFIQELKEKFGDVELIPISEVEEIRREIRENQKENVIVFEDDIALSEAKRIISNAIDEGSSDIHIEVGKDRTKVFFRKKGFLYEKNFFISREVGERIISALYNNSVGSSHSTFSIADYQYSKINVKAVIPEYSEKVEGIRMQTGPMLGGLFAVLRILYRQSSVSVNSLSNFSDIKSFFYHNLNVYGYSQRTIERIIPSLLSSDGLCIISGPTGSGKSTALKVFMELVSEVYPNKSRFTIEDPPEYEIRGSKQLPVIEGGSFLDVLRVAMRSDPDIVMVGEVRDKETAKTIVDAVLTGHQVYTTLHARDVYTIFFRMRGLGIEVEELVNDGLIKLLISQRLIPRLCDGCKEEVKIRDVKVYKKGEGCKLCDFSGYKGRTVVEECINFEDLKVASNIQMLKEKMSIERNTIRNRVISKIVSGEISLEDARQFFDFISEEEIERGV